MLFLEKLPFIYTVAYGEKKEEKVNKDYKRESGSRAREKKDGEKGDEK